ncbi:MAG: SpoIVB peptidase, partial [Acutalibacteraceae bacterium]|nr:SpoIVB peptidase [Acutalibacteraceae bacterium]
LNIFNDNKEKRYENREITEPLPQVYIGGYPIGLKLYADGVVIVGTEAVDTENGLINTAEKAGLKLGDIIKKVNGIRVKSNAEVSHIIEKSGGKELIFEAERKGKTFEAIFKAEFSQSEQKYKAGIWIRDSSAGIGTVTFCTKDGGFASLGHAVCDIDTKSTIPISQGECTEAKLTGFIKGQNGSAGELCGYLDNKRTGVIFSNDSLGVYGCFDSLPENQALYEIANASEILTGEAEIITTIENGTTEKYSIIIEKIDEKSTENKNLVIKITDRALIEKTGGIIQGMSGSPIIQNGKLVGAVTHVFLNDATGGFGIFAETMLKKLEGNVK